MRQEPEMRGQALSLPLLKQGKVRDVYAVNDRYVLIVASDRLSAFDVVLPDKIPDKGRVLTALSNFWFEKTRRVIDNHLSGVSIDKVLPAAEITDDLRARSIVAKQLTPLPFEAIVRGYLVGSGWKDYRETGMVCGVRLPAGLQLAQALPEPLFTPSTKAAVGKHDVNVPFEQVVALVGESLAERARRASLEIYRNCAAYALERGIIIADTKFEFGTDDKGELVLIDEVLTPDSSRFWPREKYRCGVSPPNFDKQFVRDYLETLDWNKQAPGPRLPREIIEKTAEKYRQVEKMLLAAPE